MQGLLCHSGLCMKDKLSLPCRVIQKQMAFMLGRHGMFLELNEDVEDYEDLTEIMSNVQLNSNFLALAREVRHKKHNGD